MESLLNREFAESLHARLSRDLSAASMHYYEIYNNEDVPFAESIKAVREVVRVKRLVDQLELAMALQEELENQEYC
jgi:hypothetical protein